jgi:hypothetical protein
MSTKPTKAKPAAKAAAEAPAQDGGDEAAKALEAVKAEAEQIRAAAQQDAENIRAAAEAAAQETRNGAEKLLETARAQAAAAVNAVETGVEGAYKVVIAGISYGAGRIAKKGHVVPLAAGEAARLQALGAVEPTDEPLTVAPIEPTPAEHAQALESQDSHASKAKAAA